MILRWLLAQDERRGRGAALLFCPALQGQLSEIRSMPQRSAPGSPLLLLSCAQPSCDPPTRPPKQTGHQDQQGSEAGNQQRRGPQISRLVESALIGIAKRGTDVCARTRLEMFGIVTIWDLS